jgi:hypothetical protein
MGLTFFNQLPGARTFHSFNVGVWDTPVTLNKHKGFKEAPLNLTGDHQ